MFSSLQSKDLISARLKLVFRQATDILDFSFVCSKATNRGSLFVSFRVMVPF